MSHFRTDVEFSTWESLLSEIIVGDAFGVDRIDYLLRDAYHAGVVFGRFDHHRLLQTLRILPKSETESVEPWLGIEAGGLEAAEALSLARYFMYKQVYFHRVRRAYDIHLKDFLKEWLPSGAFPISVEEHLEYTDNEVMSAMLAAARRSDERGHFHAKKIIDRKHFKMIYERNPEDIKKNINAVEMVFEEIKKEFGESVVRRDTYRPKASALDFPVLQSNGKVESSRNLSETLQKIRAATFDIILCDRDIFDSAQNFLDSNHGTIVKASETMA